MPDSFPEAPDSHSEREAMPESDRPELPEDFTESAIIGVFANGRVNDEYESSIEAAEDHQPCTWELTDGTLPEGLDFEDFDDDVNVGGGCDTGFGLLGLAVLSLGLLRKR